MQYEDTIRLSTPEGVEVELALAGVGSRLAARLVDLLLIAGLLIAVGVVTDGAVDDSSLGDAAIAVIGIVAAFVVIWGYDVFFETFASGRTPGKRAAGLRVVTDRGAPISFTASAVRNVLRLIDEYLTLWLAALAAILRSKRNQRLGDMAAGALVVKERTAADAAQGASVSIAALDQLDRAASWDATAVSAQELAAARRFLERRAALDGASRGRLAAELAARLRPKVHGPAGTRSNEEFLELLVAVKSRGL
jgi:uncharacterized RDD family membrane protein YckC